MPIAGALWFLTSLFFVEIIYFLIDKIINKKYKYIIIVFISLLGCITPFYFRLPYALDTSFMGVGLYSIGLLGKDYIVKRNSIYIGISAILLGTILTFFNGYVNVRRGIYDNIIVYYIVAIVMTYGLYVMSIKVKNYKNFIISELKFIGRNSLVYVCLNQFVLLVPDMITANIITNTTVLVIYKILILILSLFLLHLFVGIFNIDKFKWIVGK